MRTAIATAVTIGPTRGVELAPTNRMSCTYRHAGYLGGNRLGSVVPGNGRIVRIRVVAGPNPAPLRPTIRTGSAWIDTTTGAGIPETDTCRAPRHIGPAFRPRPDRKTPRPVNVPVLDTRSGRLDNRTTGIDVLPAWDFRPSRGR